MRRPAGRAAVRRCAGRMLPFRGAGAARRVIGFANGLSGSPGESLSRVRIHELRFPAPILQQGFIDARGRIIVDFWWPGFNLAGEFDGLVKYHRAEYMSGQTIEDVVVKEKLREDRLRRVGPSVSRWIWAEASRVRPLDAILTQAGLPRRSAGAPDAVGRRARTGGDVGRLLKPGLGGRGGLSYAVRCGNRAVGRSPGTDREGRRRVGSVKGARPA